MPLKTKDKQLLARNFITLSIDRYILAKWVVYSPIESYQRLKKMVVDAAFFNTQHFKLRIKGKLKQSRECTCCYSVL